jgi:hypothetical protein
MLMLSFFSLLFSKTHAIFGVQFVFLQEHFNQNVLECISELLMISCFFCYYVIIYCFNNINTKLEKCDVIGNLYNRLVFDHLHLNYTKYI